LCPEKCHFFHFFCVFWVYNIIFIKLWSIFLSFLIL
jgi:hypothetical protein